MPKWMVIIDYEVEAINPLAAVKALNSHHMSNLSVMRFDPTPALPEPISKGGHIPSPNKADTEKPNYQSPTPYGYSNPQ